MRTVVWDCVSQTWEGGDGDYFSEKLKKFAAQRRQLRWTRLLNKSAAASDGRFISCWPKTADDCLELRMLPAFNCFRFVRINTRDTESTHRKRSPSAWAPCNCLPRLINYLQKHFSNCLAESAVSWKPPRQCQEFTVELGSAPLGN